MTNPAPQTLTPMPAPLLDRVVAILEEARGQVVRAVNTQMVWAYWLIGREIVQALQGGDERAAYGKSIVADLSVRLTQRYGKGFSATNLWYFRQFYLAFESRQHIPHPPGGELPQPPAQGFSPQLTWSRGNAASIQYPAGTKSGSGQIGHPAGDEFADSESALEGHDLA